MYHECSSTYVLAVDLYHNMESAALLLLSPVIPTNEEVFCLFWIMLKIFGWSPSPILLKPLTQSLCLINYFIGVCVVIGHAVAAKAG